MGLFGRRTQEETQFVSVVIAAGGSGSRMGAEINKIFLELMDRPVLAHTLAAVSACPLVDEIVLVTREEDVLGCKDIVQEFAIPKVSCIIPGGTTRTESVANGLTTVSPQADIILVHDAARPLVREAHIAAVIAAAAEHGAAVLGFPAVNTIKRADESGFVAETLDRSELWEIQTPQGFRASLLQDAYAQARADGISGTDDCAIAERYGARVKLVEGEPYNLKLTTPDDLLLAEQLLLYQEEQDG